MTTDPYIYRTFDGGQQWTWGPLTLTNYTPASGNPDSLTLYSTFALTGAPQAVVQLLPPVGSLVWLEVNIPGVFIFNATYVVRPGDTIYSVAQALANFIETGAGNPDDVNAMKVAGVSAGCTPGTTTVWVTNKADGTAVTLADRTPSGPCMQINPGSLGWDAGPVFAMGKMPVDAHGVGVAPPPGSNIGQLFFSAFAAGGKGPLQYLTIGINVIDPNTGEAELAVYTANTGKQIMRLSSNGLIVNGKQVA